MHAFDVLGDPVRRRILELLADSELTSGSITAVVQAEFGISQPAVSQHLKVLRDSGFATVRPEGTRRLYAVDARPFNELDVDALQKASTRIVLALGIESHQILPGRGAKAIAERLGTEPVIFPSGHGGFLGGEYGQQAGEPEAFAAKLREVLSAS